MERGASAERSGSVFACCGGVHHRRPPRLADSDYLGATHIFFTMNTFRRQHHFTSAAAVKPILSELLRTTGECAVETIAYCFMPDHLHTLLAGTAVTSNLKACANRFRRRAGKDYRRLHTGRLWQEGYFDRSLRSSDAIIDVVAYILNNPVRAGLCRAPGEYPFSGSDRYTLEDLASAVQWKPDSVE